MSNMSSTTGSRVGVRRWPWMMSGAVGLALFAHAATLRSGFLAAQDVAKPSMPARVAAEPPMLCLIPAQAITPALQAVSTDIARRFHVAQSAAVGITHAAFTAGRIRGVDPVLVLAVAAVESKFKSRAVNPVTGATGLMQVMPQWHQDKIVKLGGDPAMLLIEPNITVGTAILADYLEAEGGNVEQALARYLGTGGGVHYTKRVQSEMQHLTKVVSRT